ncbi:MAG: helix-turn-helix domain-containing protein [Bacteroidales bacterium]
MTDNLNVSPLVAESVFNCENDFVLIDNPLISFHQHYPFKSDMTIAVFCNAGALKARINMRDFQISPNGFGVVLSGQVFEAISISSDFKGTTILMSRHFLDSLEIGDSFKFFKIVDDKPYYSLEDRQALALTSYLELCRGILYQKKNPNVFEILRLLTKAFFLGLGYYIHSLPSTDNELKSRKSDITMQFINLVEHDYSLHRDLDYYAQSMCLSPKYISMTVKETSGRPATDWIDSYVVLDAKAQLASTSKTIASISEELNFPSQSFFGKYFKRVTGQSPAEYRKTVQTL